MNNSGASSGDAPGLARALAALLALPLGLLACDDAPPRSARSDDAREERSRDEERSGAERSGDERSGEETSAERRRVGETPAVSACSLTDDARPILRDLPATTRAAAITVSEQRAFIVAATGDELLEIATLDLASEGAEPTRRSVAFPGARALLALEPVEGARAIALTQTSCPDGHEAARCLGALLIGADAAAIGQPISVGLPAEMRTRRIASAGRSAYVLRSHARGAPGLDVFDARAEGLSHRRVPLADGLTLDEETVEVMALAVADGAWAVLYRHGAAEDPRSAVVLATHMDEHSVPELAEALVVESFAWSAGSLSLVVSLEFARPSLLRLGADGELQGPAVLLTRGQPLPPPFSGRRVAALRGSGPEAAIEIRDGGGDRTGAPIAIGSASFVFADFEANEEIGRAHV